MPHIVKISLEVYIDYSCFVAVLLLLLHSLLPHEASA